MDEPQNEFLSFKLRQTSRDGAGGRGRKAEPEPKVDFGVQLKSTVSHHPVPYIDHGHVRVHVWACTLEMLS